MAFPSFYRLMRDEKEGRSKQGQTNNKAKQRSTPKAITFPKKNELPRVVLKPMTLHSRQSTCRIYTHHQECMRANRSKKHTTFRMLNLCNVYMVIILFIIMYTYVGMVHHDPRVLQRVPQNQNQKEKGDFQ